MNLINYVKVKLKGLILGQDYIKEQTLYKKYYILMKSLRYFDVRNDVLGFLEKAGLYDMHFIMYDERHSPNDEMRLVAREKSYEDVTCLFAVQCNKGEYYASGNNVDFEKLIPTFNEWINILNVIRFNNIKAREDKKHQELENYKTKRDALFKMCILNNS